MGNFNIHDISRNAFMLTGGFARQGYDWWWHSFTGYSEETGEERAFYIEFFVINPALAEEEPVFGQLEVNRKNGRKPSYLMVNVGTWGKGAKQLHRFFSLKHVTIDGGVPFSVSADDCFLDETSTRGSVCVSREGSREHPEWMSDEGSMEWDLRIDKQVAYNVGYGASGPFRKRQAFEMFWHAEGMKSAFSGHVTLDGERYRVSPEDCFGYADKNWGRDFTSPWVWLSSNNLTSLVTGKRLENSVFDIGGGRPKVAGIALDRKLLSAFWYEGECFEFNFSKFWTFTKTQFSCRETDTQIIWHVKQESTSGRMVTDITCEKEDMILINYEAPDGSKRHNRLWNGGNGKGTVKLYRKGKLIDEIACRNVGCEWGEYGR